MLLCLDGGTTNTRIRLMTDDKVTDTVQVKIGSSEKDNTALKCAVKEMISKILERNNLQEKDICAVLTAGMITSEFGLFELPHITAPAGVKEFADSIKEVLLPEISTIPFWFIPGLKNNEPEPNMMRGEETECIGLCASLNVHEPVAIILPGTHNKVILFDENKITACNSMMSGELIAALHGYTLLRHALPEKLPKEYDESALFAGADYCKMYGLTDAALRVRSIQKAGTRTQDWLASYLVGAVLYCDIIAISGKSQGCRLLIGGANPLRSEVASLCARYLPNLITVLEDSVSVNATAIGQKVIYDEKTRKS